MEDGSKKSRRIGMRALVSLLTAWMFTVSALTGLVLYFVPPGRIAYWTEWRFLGLEKSDWSDAHVVSTILFVAAGGLHLYYNWRPFVGYLRRKAEGAVRLRAELAVATAVAAFAVLSAILSLPPLGWIADLKQWVETAWVEPGEEPPFGHAEMVPLDDLCRKTGIDPAEAIEVLGDRGVEVSSPDETLGSVARRAGLSPREVFAIIEGLAKNDRTARPRRGLRTGRGRGMGMGKRRR